MMLAVEVAFWIALALCSACFVADCRMLYKAWRLNRETKLYPPTKLNEDSDK